MNLCSFYVDLFNSRYVEEKSLLSIFATYRISQDHIEIYFGKIRASNGCNDNPNQQQFEAAYRKMSHQSDIMISKAANIEIVDQETSPTENLDGIISNILVVSSRRPKICENFETDDTYDEQAIEINEENHQMQSALTTAEFESNLTDLTNDAGISFTAHELEKKLITCDQIFCIACKRILECNEKLDVKKYISDNRPCVGS